MKPDFWDELINSLKNETSKPAFNMFTNSVKVLNYNEGILEFVVPNNHIKNWIKEHIEGKIQAILWDKFQITAMISFMIDTTIFIDNDSGLSDEADDDEISTTKEGFSKQVKKQELPNNLNPQYTFDSFVVGHNCRFAHAAGKAVADAPTKAYNPLFIYGGAGLGKTHLLNAIGNRIIENNPETKVLYVTSEKFMNDFIESIQGKKGDLFRNYYRNIDVLLVDDVQFFNTKERTQEEFFHTFNSLYESNKQIILSSDRSPKDMPELDDRLITRFSCGLLTDIQPPQIETRIAILKQKVIDESIDVPDDVLEFIAHQIPSNVRNLQGALNRLVAYASLINSEITISLASEVLKDMIIASRRQRPLTISNIKQAVAEYFTMDVEELSARVKTKDIAEARQVAMYLSRELTSSSLPKIGSNFGRDHTTVLHACDKIKSLIKSDNDFNIKIESIKSSIKN